MSQRKPRIIFPIALLLLSSSDAESELPPKSEQATQAPAAEDPGWTKPVNGIRATAFAVQDRVPVGQAAHLIVLFKNVSDKTVTLPQVYLMPTVALALDDHPFGNDHPFNAIIVQSVPGADGMCILWAQQKAVRRLKEVSLERRLQPGQLLALSVTLKADRDLLERVLSERLVSHRKEPSIAVLRHETQLLSSSDPGPRDLEFVFRPAGFCPTNRETKLTDDAVPWQDVEFRLPPVRIEIYDPSQPLRKSREQE